MTTTPSRPDFGGRIRHVNRSRSSWDTLSDGHCNGHHITQHDEDAVPGQIHRFPANGGTYRSTAAAGRQVPTPHTSWALAKMTGTSLRRVRVDAGGTRLRLRALHVMGYSSARIARALGVREITIRAITRGDARTVSTALRDDIAGLYDRWRDMRAPERTPRQRAAATAARRRAIAGNWYPGAGLDDHQLEIPGYKPTATWKPAAGSGLGTQAPDATRYPAQPGTAESSHPCQ
jgi:hypothetical protein